MKKTIIILGFIAILSSCNNGRIVELEAENTELKAMVERLTLELTNAKMLEQRAIAIAQEAQIMAEEQAANAAANK